MIPSDLLLYYERFCIEHKRDFFSTSELSLKIHDWFFEIPQDVQIPAPLQESWEHLWRLKDEFDLTSALVHDVWHFWYAAIVALATVKPTTDDWSRALSNVAEVYQPTRVFSHGRFVSKRGALTRKDRNTDEVRRHIEGELSEGVRNKRKLKAAYQRSILRELREKKSPPELKRDAISSALDRILKDLDNKP